MKLTPQEMALVGICCDCGMAIKPMTEEQIAEAEDDLGLDDGEFSGVCDDCLEAYAEYWRSRSL